MRSLILAALLLPISAHAQKPFSWAELIGDVADAHAKKAAIYTAEELYRLGKGGGTIGYVVGVVDADYASSTPWHYCIPSGVTVGQIADVAWRHLEQNPQDRHFGAAYMVRRGLASAWPCNR
jgi:hypothetical protein